MLLNGIFVESREFVQFRNELNIVYEKKMQKLDLKRECQQTIYIEL